MTNVYWTNASDGNFETASRWSTGVVPGAGDDAIINSAGAPFAVFAHYNDTVNAVATSANATLVIGPFAGGPGNTFTVANGTDNGVNLGSIVVEEGCVFATGGTFDNAGSIRLAPQTGYATVQLDADATFTGGGVITCDGEAHGARIVSASGGDFTLTNVNNTIQVQIIGAGDINLVNRSHGTITNNGTDALRIRTVAGVASTNAGLIEGGAGASLILQQSTFNNSGGVILAAAGSDVSLEGADIIGGMLSSKGAGVVTVDGGYGNSTLDGRTGRLTLSGSLVVEAQATLIVEGAIVNKGVMNLAGVYTHGGVVMLGAKTKLTGGGQVVLGNDAVNALTGAGGADLLTNADNTISGAGLLGAGSMRLINGAHGVIDADYANGLTIDTGRQTINNSGLIETTGGGGLSVVSALDTSGVVEATNGTLSLLGAVTNTGAIIAAGGTVIATGAVSGRGSAIIDSGALEFAKTFSEDVTFTGSGTLELGESRRYKGRITGFSLTGADTLDLSDIGFKSANEATFSGNGASGVLNVTDGTHTAHITLLGDYTGVTFVASSDGHGGAAVTVAKAQAVNAVHTFISAMAGLRSPAGQAIHPDTAATGRENLLSSPRIAIA